MILDYSTLSSMERELGDSWYLLDIERFKANYHEFLRAFHDIYPNVKIAYSYKTNYLPTICKTVDELGGFAEVVSEMEYTLAMALGVAPQNIIVNGPYKPAHALEAYLRNGSIVNVDSFSELELVKNFVNKYKNIKVRIGIRCNFKIENQEQSRFGIDVNDPQFEASIREITFFDNIDFVSLHCHYPYRNLDSFLGRSDGLLKVYDRLSNRITPKYIDIGGGWGGKVSKELSQHIGIKEVSYQDYATVVATRFYERFKNDEYKPTLIMEPGTALVADTMSFVCKVTDIKEIRGHSTATTSGARVNYHSRTSKLNLPLRVFSPPDGNKPYFKSIDIAGYTCMEEDFIYRGYSGQLCVNDYVVVDNVGSYSIVFKPPFINPNVPVATFVNEKLKIIKEKESFKDVFATYLL